MGRCATIKSLCSIISKSLCNYKIPLVLQRRDAKGVNSLMQPASERVKVVDFYLQAPLTCLPTQNVIEPFLSILIERLLRITPAQRFHIGYVEMNHG